MEMKIAVGSVRLLPRDRMKRTLAQIVAPFPDATVDEDILDKTVISPFCLAVCMFTGVSCGDDLVAKRELGRQIIRAAAASGQGYVVNATVDVFDALMDVLEQHMATYRQTSQAGAKSAIEIELGAVPDTDGMPVGTSELNSEEPHYTAERR